MKSSLLQSNQVNNVVLHWAELLFDIVYPAYQREREVTSLLVLVEQQIPIVDT